MGSSIQRTFATLLLMVPVGAIPALAIFGIPQFAPVVASPLDEGKMTDRENRIGHSDRGPDDDMFADLDDFPDTESKDLKSFDSPSAESFTADRSRRIGDSVPVKRPGNTKKPDDSIAELNDSSRHHSQRKSERGLEVVPSENDAHSTQPDWADDREMTDSHSNHQTQIDWSESKQNANPDQGSRQSVSPGKREKSKPFIGKERSENPLSRVRQNSQRDSDIQLVSGQEQTEAPESYQRQRDSSAPRPVQSNPESERPELTWQDAVRNLNELGIRNFRLEPARQPGQFVFVCSLTPTNSPRVSYQFEAEADEPLKAVEKVLSQIDEWQQRK